MGPWEGLFREQIADRFPGMFREWYRRPDLVRFPRGEALQDVQIRAQSVLDDIFQRHLGENVCVVTHSAVIQAFVASSIGLDLRYVHRLHIANAGITTLSGDRAPGSLISLNLTEHLHALPAAGELAEACAGADRRRLAS